MVNVREAALSYQDMTTQVVSDLEIFDTILELLEFSGENADGPFTYKYVEQAGIKYRVPKSVVGQVKVFLEEEPTLRYFKVKKTGEGLKTTYTVIPTKVKAE